MPGQRKTRQKRFIGRPFRMYSAALEARQCGNRARFKGLLEIISSEVVILAAVHNIKANRGSETPAPPRLVKDSALQRKTELELIRPLSGGQARWRAE
jgi:hypothetical protein